MWKKLATLTLSALCLPLLVQSQKAQPAMQPSNCASPGGFTSCFATLADQHLQCSAAAGSNTAKRSACDCALRAGELVCALTDCWNVVYSCEYQTLANILVGDCGASDLPHFPAPENAPGRCSCNLGHIIYNITDIESQSLVCARQANQNFDTSQVFGCACCSAAGFYTSKFSICPGVDPDLDGRTGDVDIVQAALPQFSICYQAFENYNCVRDLSFPEIGSLSYLTELPSVTGAASFSNLPGTISNPIAGSTLSLSFSGSLLATDVGTVITAVNAGATGKATTSSNGAATTDGTSNIAGQVRPSIGLIITCLFGLAFTI